MEITEELYDRLSEQAAQRQVTPEQLIERLLTDDSAPMVTAGEEPDAPVPPAGSDEVLVAVQRLTTLFAAVVIPDLDQAFTDPLIALANADAVPAPREC
jgi:hypothetical protein